MTVLCFLDTESSLCEGWSGVMCLCDEGKDVTCMSHCMQRASIADITEDQVYSETYRSQIADNKFSPM